MQAVVRVDWIEIEPGWGERPDGTTLHKDMATARKHIDDFLGREKDRPHNPKADYSRPGEPRIVECGPETYAKVQEQTTMWWNNGDSWAPKVLP